MTTPPSTLEEAFAQYPETPLVSAELRSADGKVIAKGSALPPEPGRRLTFYPFQIEQEGTLLETANILFLCADAKEMSLAKGEKCPCSGIVHYHFDRA
ncbi:MAG: hypothetical protein Q7S40_09135 [Opitutaceae bacterium]|nr:hypothetical protein [Opitutaceae bacterium]